MNLRIQTDGTMTPKEALMKGLDDLELLLQHMQLTFKQKIADKDYEITDGGDPDQE